MHTVSIGPESITINGHAVALPLTLAELKIIVGNGEPAVEKTKYNIIFIWHDAGIYAYSADGKTVQAVAFEIKKERTYKFLPKTIFQGNITINNNIALADWPITKEDPTDTHSKWVVGNITVFCQLNDADEILAVELSEYKPEVIPDPDRYIFKPIAGKPMQFVDLNFKLAVIGVLMYEKELIKPAFDIFEFAKRYKTRTIDVDSEGYDVIPEALEYFKQLQIDEALAPEVDELTQDGGNDIYMNIIPFWSGTTDDFNIQSFDDVDQFPNLKYITLFYDERLKEIQQSLAKKGIQVEPL